MQPHITARRAGLILLRARIRRLINRVAAFRRRRPSPDRGDVRRLPTAPKGGLALHWVVLVAFGFAWTALTFSSDLLDNVARHFGPVVPGAGAESFSASAHFLTFELSLILLTCILTTLGNKELAAPEWDLEWLVTLPVPLRGLLAMRLLERAAVNAYGLFILFPFLAMTAWKTGGGRPAAVALALLVGLVLMTLVAAGQTVVETALRLRLAPSRLRNFQATFSVLGVVPLFLAMAPGMARRAPLFQGAAALPGWTEWTPPGLAVGLLTGQPLAGAGPWLPALLLAGEAALVVVAALAWLDRALRPGVVAGGVREASRRPPAAARAESAAPLGRSRSLLTAVQRRELRLLGRDRNFLVQTLVMPLVVMGSQVFFSLRTGGGPGEVLTGSPAALAALAFGVASYTLMFSALQTLNAEGLSLWILYAVPRPLPQILREKATLWAALGTVYPVAIFTASFATRGTFSAELIGLAVIVLAGVPVYAVVGVSLGVFACNPLAQEVHRKVKPGYLYLFLLLASLYTYAIFASTFWARGTLMILTVLLALALWQKARDRLPYLLDPSASPRATVSLSDGLIAALLFFVLQGAVMLVLHRRGLTPTGAHLFTAFAIAGAISFAAMRITFALARAGGVPRVFGVGSARAAFLGAGAGLTAGAVGTVYLAILQGTGRLAPFLERDRTVLDAAATPWIFALAVLAAPVFEEFIFRGLIFGGLRRSVRRGTATLASAAIFAIIHPAVAVPPVFVLGLATALVYERSKLLLAPMAAHAVYNAVVLSVSRWWL